MVCVGSIEAIAPATLVHRAVVDFGGPLGQAHVVLLPLGPSSTCRPDLGWHALEGGSCLGTPETPATGTSPLVWCKKDHVRRLGKPQAMAACGTALGRLLGKAVANVEHTNDHTLLRGCVVGEAGWAVNSNRRMYRCIGATNRTGVLLAADRGRGSLGSSRVTQTRLSKSLRGLE